MTLAGRSVVYMTIVESIEYKLGQIEGKIDLLLDRTAGQERRIRGLEAFRWKLAGALAVLSLMASFLGAWVVHRG